MANKHKIKGSPETVSPGLGQTKNTLGDSELKIKQASCPAGSESGAQLPGGISMEDFAQFGRFIAALAEIASFVTKPSAVATDRRPPLTRGDADVLVAAFLDQLMRRVPLKPRPGEKGERCFFSDLNRGQFYELFAKKHNGKDVVMHCTLAEEGEKGGAHFYNVGSVLKYLRERAAKQMAGEDNQT